MGLLAVGVDGFNDLLDRHRGHLEDTRSVRESGAARRGRAAAAGVAGTHQLGGGDFRGEGLLVRQRRQRYVPPLQEALVLVRFAQLHALGDPLLPEFLQEAERE